MPVTARLSDSTTDLDGTQLLACFEQAAIALRAASPRLDAMNVYPVPDGDTGSNMSATLEEAVHEARSLPGAPTASEVLNAVARGALYGARGNSGVILSQALRGLAMDAPAAFDVPALALALAAAAREAYRAVARPVEGTMLTVLRAAADGAGAANAKTVAELLDAALTAARIAESETPSHLATLAEAGVTDSGGEGVCVILAGLLAAFEGRALPMEAPGAPHPAAAATRHNDDPFGFCTEFVLEAGPGSSVDVGAVRELVSRAPNRSVVLAGDAQLLRVHVHSDEPAALLAAAAEFGQLRRSKVDDMDAQYALFGAGGSGASARVAALALSPGPGFDAIFEGLGVRCVRLDAVARPSAGELARAADALRVPDVILLPNHPNVVLAARQAVALAACSLAVVATESSAEGVAAALAFDADRPLAENIEVMSTAARQITTVEVTIAAANRTVAGVAMRKGQPIALARGKPVATADTAVEALLAGLASAGAAGAGLLTLFGGSAVSSDGLEAARVAVADRFGGEVEAHAGGQELYEFIASVEA